VKLRTRRLIQLGGLVEKAQLHGWNSNALYGALLFVKEKELDKTQVETWATKGGVAFSADKPNKVTLNLGFSLAQH
jgi:hypothetical protein